MTNHKKVIALPKAEPTLWRWYGIEYPSRYRPVDVWYRDELSDEAKFAVRDALKDAQKIDNPRNWVCFKRFMQGDLKKHKVWELQFDCGDNIPYRLLGVFGDERKQAIFIIGCYHKGSTYTPTGALKTAYERARDVKEKRVALYERKIPTDQ